MKFVHGLHNRYRATTAREWWRRAVSVVLFTIALAACGPSNTEAIRHVVLAEVIQREKVPESHVEIKSVHFHGEHGATVEVRIIPQEPRGAQLVNLECEVVRQSGRWKVDKVRQLARDNGG